ncbi:hypothetical protein ACQP00_06305 [Dactylosporangium sp. CS-047395]
MADQAARPTIADAVIIIVEEGNFLSTSSAPADTSEETSAAT